MEPIRKPFQGVTNIIRFNWHFYLFSIAVTLVVFLLGSFLKGGYQLIVNLICIGIIVTTIISLLVSYYIYDLSDLYQFNWLKELNITVNSHLVNINAGFDETSVLLANKFPGVSLTVFDL